MNTLGPVTQAALSDPVFAGMLWKATPASLAVKLSNGNYKTWHYIQLLSRKLVDVAMGRCKRLIVVMPPRHGKSELVSKYFPTWYIEMFQNRRVILASYEAEFAAKWGGKVRDLIADNQDILSVRFKNKNPSMHAWETTQDPGGMMCAGVGGPITGKGANVFIIDDFVKNSEEANSFTMRNKMWDWWTSTARTRIEPGGSVVVMATRWHSDDLIGRLINPEFSNEKGTREDWEVFCFPALAEPESERHYSQFGVKVNDLRTDALSGADSVRKRIALEDSSEWRDILGRKRGEALCPDRYDEDALSKIRGGSLRDWFALFQQRPGDEADDGNVYHAFDEKVNCKQLERNDRMQLFVSMDFNVDPMCAVIGQYERSHIRMMERCEVLEEIILPDSNTQAMMERIILELRKYRRGYTLSVEFYGDAAGTQRSSQSQKTNWQIVADNLRLDASIHFKFLRRKANPMIVDRVNAVNTMLKSADGTSRLFIHDLKCQELIKDFNKVKWDQDSSGNSTGLLDKSDKKRTHISDALGYHIEYNFGLRTRSGERRGIMQ